MAALTTKRPRAFAHNLVWEVATLSWAAMTQPGGGSGGATTIADGADVAQGTTSDVAWVSGSGTVIAILKKIAAGSTVTANAGTNLNTSALALEAGHLATIDAKIPALGQALAAASVPVILPSATITTLTPPAAITGYALEAGHLSTIDTAVGRIPAQGQALAAASTPVVLTALQVSALTPPAAIVGFALEAGHLAAIDTSTAKIPSQGQALAAASTPVVLTAIQVAALTPPASVNTKTDLTPSAPTVASVGASSAQAVAAQPTRKGLALRNLSTTGQRISLGFGQAAVLDSGVTLYPQDLFRMDEYDFDLGAVNAIASAASASLAIQEYLT